VSKTFQIRLLAGLVVATVIPIGLIARSFRSGASTETILGFAATYLGDTLWPMMFYFIGRFLFPTALCRRLFFFVLALTLTIEFGQLWKPPLLQWLRQQPISGFLLGNSFVWSDVICCTIGAVAAVVIDAILQAATNRRVL